MDIREAAGRILLDYAREQGTYSVYGIDMRAGKNMGDYAVTVLAQKAVTMNTPLTLDERREVMDVGECFVMWVWDAETPEDLAQDMESGYPFWRA